MTAQDGYTGPATLTCDDESRGLRVRLSGRLEPVDGRFHWGGTVTPDEWAAGACRRGARDVTLRIGDGPELPVRLTEVNPWGGVGLTATGRPPWPAYDPVDEAATEPDPAVPHVDIAVIGAGRPVAAGDLRWGVHGAGVDR